jgi:RNA polymerase sigma-70 factor (ECF subfamily)
MEPTRPGLIQQFVRDRGQHLGFLRVICRDPDLAEDLFQELSVVVIEKIPAFDPERDFGAWVRGIARNLHRRALESRRDRGRDQVVYNPALVDAVLAAYESRAAAEREEKKDHAQRLQRCLAQLPPHHRELMRDRYESNQPIPRIAEIHRRTVSAVETALSRIRAALLECVQRSLATPS